VKRAGLGLLFFGWLYGVPFLLVVGLVRRAWSGSAATNAEAVAFGRITDIVLLTGLCLNLLLPAAGIVWSLWRARDWVAEFVTALVGMFLIFLAVTVVAGQAGTPLIGHRPDSREPRPQITQCIPISGGRGCPGG
jgi:hypothetical protein